MNVNIAYRSHSAPPPVINDPEPLPPGAPPVDPDEGPLPLPIPDDPGRVPVIEPGH